MGSCGTCQHWGAYAIRGSTDGTCYKTHRPKSAYDSGCGLWVGKAEERAKQESAKKEAKEALEKLCKAEEQGDANVLYNVALQYLNGEDVSLEVSEKAKKLIKKAAKQGHEEAKKFIAKAKRHNLNCSIIGGIIYALVGLLLGLVSEEFLGTIIFSGIYMVIGIITGLITGNEDSAGNGALVGFLLGAISFAIAFAILCGVSDVNVAVGIFGGAASGAIVGGITGAICGGKAK